MKISEMKKIADARNDDEDTWDEFMSMTHRNWDKLIAVVEASKDITDSPDDIGIIASQKAERLIDAIKKLESE